MSHTPPTPPPPPVHRPRINGRLLVVAGIVVAFGPIAITLVASIFDSNAMSEGASTWGTLPLLSIFTFPVGGAIALAGIVLGGRKSTRGR